VGEKNYRLFLILLSTTNLFVAILLGAALYVMVLYLNEHSKHEFDDKLDEYTGFSPYNHFSLLFRHLHSFLPLHQA
jgi:hypothetical protein